MDFPQDDSHAPAATATGPAGGARSPRDDADGAAGRPGCDEGEQWSRYGRLAADTIDTFADGIETMAAGMREGDAAHLSGQVVGMTGGLRRLSDTLRSQRAEQLLRDTGRVARENPLLLVAGGIAIGLGLAQLTQASLARMVAPGDRPRAGRSTVDPGPDARPTPSGSGEACHPE